MGEVVRMSRRAVALLIGVIASPLIEGAMAADPTPTWVGTGSCSATACHKARHNPLELKGSEYEFSGAYDPHTRAYQVLYGERSKTIFKNLKDQENVDNIDAVLPRPITNDLCLRCHVYQGFDTKAPQTRGATFALEDGVGCEGCHGAAGNWLVPHSEWWWKGLSDDQKRADFGMQPTKDLLSRGERCTQCHVGIGDADMNHDLIAAGHPRLNFEYGNQLAKLPKHWELGDDKARHPDYEAKVWALGQVLSAKAAVDLLAARATRSSGDQAPWPEFSEYSCFSCHHELKQVGWRRQAKPGALPWGSWYLSASRALGEFDFDPDIPGTPLGGLGREMIRPLPKQGDVVRQAQVVSARLDQLARSLNARTVSPGEMKQWLTRVLAIGDDGRPIDWDQAAQQYLAVVALDKGLSEYDPRYFDPSVKSTLDDLYRKLDLPRIGSDRPDESPSTAAEKARPGTFDSPYNYTPELIVDELRKLQAALPKP